MAIRMPVRRPDVAAIRLIDGACSHIGLRRRRNEDSYLAAPDHGLFAVADGMGGHPAGDVASRTAIETLADSVARQAPGVPGDRTASGPDASGDGRATDGAGALLSAAFARANAALLEYALARPDHNGLGTTLTALLIRGRHAVIGHIGDSRLYLVRGDECRQLTTDHTWVEREVAQGRLSRSGARHHPHSAVLLRVLGGADANIDLHDIELKIGDRLVLCTDGVSNPLKADELAAIIRQSIPAADVARHLCEAADARGGHDNSTAVVVDVR